MFEVFVLSLVQGITEFLPISSSGHLILARFLFGWQDTGMALDVGLHVGTLLAVLIYFFKDFLYLALHFWKEKKALSFLLRLIVATLPIAVVGFIFKEVVENEMRAPQTVAFCLIFFGIILYLADKQKGMKSMDEMTYKDAFFIGLAQCLAIVPGVSRSGITMTMARFCKVRRSAAARFSMMLSVPTIMGAALLQFADLYSYGQLDKLNGTFYFGLFCSFVGGLSAIYFLMKWVQNRSFLPFTVYRVALGLLILYLCA